MIRRKNGAQWIGDNPRALPGLLKKAGHTGLAHVRHWEGQKAVKSFEMSPGYGRVCTTFLSLDRLQPLRQLQLESVRNLPLFGIELHHLGAHAGEETFCRDHVRKKSALQGAWSALQRVFEQQPLKTNHFTKEITPKILKSTLQ